MRTKKTLILALLLIAALAAGCTQNESDAADGIIAGSAEPLVISDTDYSDMKNWMSFGGDGGKDVDIFAVYPTLANSDDEADKPYVRLDSEIMRGAATAWIDDMDGIISAHTNVYAPLYRQINVATLPTIGNNFDEFANGTPREDIFAAFDYYLKNVNKGERPFILIGHSQGSHMAGELATTFLGNEAYVKYNKNHIITYVIGVSVTEAMIARNPNIKFSQGPDDTGVIVSWNTNSPSEEESGAYKGFGTWKEGALVTNPLTWLTDETPAEAVPFAKEYISPFGPKSVVGYAGAVVDNDCGLLLVTTFDEAEYEVPMGGLLSRYHGYDVWFFADSITQNIKDRITAFAR